MDLSTQLAGMWALSDEGVGKHAAECRAAFPWFDQLSEPRRAVIIGLCSRLGVQQLLAFGRMLDSIRDERFAHAAELLRQSHWARSTPKRAVRLAYMLETGEWN